MTLDDIISVEYEMIRFQKRIADTKKRIEEEGMYLLSGCRETGALKRGAMDLKNELTKLTK